MNRSPVLFALLANTDTFSETDGGSTLCNAGDGAPAPAGGDVPAAKVRAARRSPAEMEAARAAGTVPARKAKGATGSATAPRVSQPRASVSLFFVTHGFDAVADAIDGALVSKTNAIFDTKNARLALRGDSAARLRGLSREEAEESVLADISIAIEGDLQLDPIDALTSPTTVAYWAAARVVLQNSLGGAFANITQK